MTTPQVTGALEVHFDSPELAEAHRRGQDELVLMALRLIAQAEAVAHVAKLIGYVHDHATRNRARIQRRLDRWSHPRWRKRRAELRRRLLQRAKVVRNSDGSLTCGTGQKRFTIRRVES